MYVNKDHMMVKMVKDGISCFDFRAFLALGAFGIDRCIYVDMMVNKVRIGE